MLWTPCDSRDLLIFSTKGVYDNLNPYVLGKSVKELGLKADSWEDAVREPEYHSSITRWRNTLIERMVFESGGSTSLLTKRYAACNSWVHVLPFPLAE